MRKTRARQAKEQSNKRDEEEENFEEEEDDAEMEEVLQSGSDEEFISKQRHLIDKDEESDSDNAPEDVSFAQGKKEALESVSEALKQIQENRKKLKEKRRKHHELLRVQKQQKVEKLQKKKLSAEFLEEVSKRSFQAPSSEEPKLPQVKGGKASEHRHFEGDENEEEEEDIGYVPLAIDDRFQVVAASKAEKKPTPTPQDAKMFLQETLYGKYVRRKRVSDIKSFQAKKQFKPSVNFACPKRRGRRRGKRNTKKET